MVSIEKSKVNCEKNLNLNSIGIGKTHPCFIIAEIGQNHQGNLENAKELIQLAKNCGVDCVKFQKSSLHDRFTKLTLESKYDSINSFGSTYGQHRAHLEFSQNEFRELKYFAENKVGIHFSSSAMDIPSADFLMGLGVPFIKIGSGDTNNFLLIEHIAKQKYPIILSTGMQTFSTVKKVYKLIKKYEDEVAILHCVSAYPTPFEDVNLQIIQLYKNEFPDTLIGYSGHESGINVSIAAVALGAKIIERHFTKDKKQKGTDHPCSLDPTEMQNLVRGIREVEKAFGITSKRILNSEDQCRLKLGKSIVASKCLTPGKKLKLSDMNVKVSRPMGIPPENIYDIVGVNIALPINEDEPIILNEKDEAITTPFD